MLGEFSIDFVFVDGVLALLEQIGVMQHRLVARGKVLTARGIEKIVDHGFGQAFGLGNIPTLGRAIASLMRDRNLDAILHHRRSDRACNAAEA
jgi:hypothetical protein